MRRTKDDSDRTRQALLDAAARIFARDGYTSARLEQIAAAAGVTRGAIAHHFGGKAEVFAALIASKQAVIEETVKAALDLGGSPGERLRRFMVALLVRLEEDEDYRLMTELTLFHRGGYPPEGSPLSPPRITAYGDGIAQLLAAGIAAGEVRDGLDPKAGAQAVLGLLCGVSVNWLLAPGTFSLKQDAAGIVDAFLSGLLRSGAHDEETRPS